MASAATRALYRTVTVKTNRLKKETRAMPKTDFTGVTASDPNAQSSYTEMGAGAYIVTSTAAYPDSFKFKRRDGVEQEVLQLRLVFDIAAGEFQGEYSDEWGKDPAHDFAHSVAIRYDTGAAKLLGIFEKLAGGEAREVERLQEAWNTDDWAAFKGLTFGLAAGAQHYTNNAGYEHVRPYWRKALWLTPAEVIAGKYELPADVDSKGQPLAAAAPAASSTYSDEDLPF